jgi:hypothetical protein
MGTTFQGTQISTHTLAENFEQTRTIEFQMKGCKEGHISLMKKETQPLPKRGILLTRPLVKQIELGLGKEGGDLENLQQMIKKISNELVDMKRSLGRETKIKDLINPYLK